jgi:hypothetical protein
MTGAPPITKHSRVTEEWFEITPEMIETGGRVVCEELEEDCVLGPTRGRLIAERILRAVLDYETHRSDE